MLYIQESKTCQKSSNQSLIFPCQHHIFYAGVLNPRKNALGVLRGFIRAKLEFNIPDKLIIAGRGEGDYLNQIKHEIEALKMQNEVLLVGYLDASELAYIMKRAKAFIFPSLFEGFGMPVIEAMKCGVPVVTSNTSALLEAGAGASIQVDPHDSVEITHALVSMQDEGEREKYITQGLEKSKTFTWEVAAKEFYEVIAHYSNL